MLREFGVKRKEGSRIMILHVRPAGNLNQSCVSLVACGGAGFERKRWALSCETSRFMMYSLVHAKRFVRTSISISWVQALEPVDKGFEVCILSKVYGRHRTNKLHVRTHSTIDQAPSIIFCVVNRLAIRRFVSSQKLVVTCSFRAISNIFSAALYAGPSTCGIWQSSA